MNEARALSNKIVAQQQTKAEEWAANEAEFIDAKIQEACLQGKYSTSYWWSNELLIDANINKDYAADALIELLWATGYRSIQVSRSWGNNCVLRLEIEWLGDVDDE